MTDEEIIAKALAWTEAHAANAATWAVMEWRHRALEHCGDALGILGNEAHDRLLTAFREAARAAEDACKASMLATEAVGCKFPGTDIDG